MTLDRMLLLILQYDPYESSSLSRRVLPSGNGLPSSPFTVEDCRAIFHAILVGMHVLTVLLDTKGIYRYRESGIRD